MAMINDGFSNTTSHVTGLNGTFNYIRYYKSLGYDMTEYEKAAEEAEKARREMENSVPVDEFGGKMEDASDGQEPVMTVNSVKVHQQEKPVAKKPASKSSSSKKKKPAPKKTASKK